MLVFVFGFVQLFSTVALVPVALVPVATVRELRGEVRGEDPIHNSQL